MKIKEMYKNENKYEYGTDYKNHINLGSLWYDDPIELIDSHLNSIIALFDQDEDFTPEECKQVLNACINEYINHMIKKTGNKDINQNGVTPNRELVIDNLEAKIPN